MAINELAKWKNRGVGIVVGSGGGFSFGNALEFNGAQNVTFSIVSPLPKTVSFWFKPNNLSGVQTILNAGNMITVGTTTIQIRGVNFGGLSLVQGNWIHLCVVDTGATRELFIDGVSVGTGAANAWNFAGIGQNNTCVFNEFGCSTDTATAQQIADLYNGGNGNDFAGVMSNVTLHYKFNQDCPDSTVTDSSSSSNNGTMINFSFSPCPWIPH